MNEQLLTKRQAEVLKFICDTLREKGYSPSMSEICRRFGLSSPASAHKITVQLEKKGYLNRQRYQWNGLIPAE